MFTIKNPNLVLLLADNCRGKFKISEDSPLAKLNRLPIGEVTNIDQLLASYNNDTQHEAFMSAMEKEIETVLRTRISFIRNTVTDTIESIFNDVEVELKETMKPRSPINIVQKSVPAILDSEFLVGMVDKYKESPLQDYKLTGFPELTKGELVNLAMSAVDDTEVQTMVADLIDSFNISIVDVYNRLFRDIKTKAYPSAFESVRPCYVQFTYLEQALHFVLLQAFYNAPHPQVNMNLQDYNANLAVALTQVGRKLANSISVITRAVKGTDRLLDSVDRLPSGEVTIVVNPKPYSLFLDQPEAKPETVIGLYNSGDLEKVVVDGNAGVGSLLSQIMAGNKSFTTYNNYLVSITNDGRRVQAIKLIMAQVSNIIKDSSFPRPMGRTDLQIIEDCREAAAKFGSFSPDTMYYLVREIVCNGLYPNSGANTYLRAMDRYQKENPNLKPREAATLAMRDVLVDWSCKQIVQ